MAERAVAPYVRDDVHNLLLDHQRTAERVSALEHQMAEVLAQLHHCVERIDGFEAHLPTLLNAINSSNATARLLMREIGEAQSQIAAQAEKLHELHYGGDAKQPVEP
jgi:chromosome segregation ATPase